MSGENNSDALKNSELLPKSKTLHFDAKYMYILAKLVASGEADFDSINIKELITLLVGERFGEMGKALPIDLMKYNKVSKEVVLRCSSDSFNRVCSSLLFFMNYKNVTCSFQIMKCSYSSLGLVGCSRTYSHHTPTQSAGARKRKH